MDITQFDITRLTTHLPALVCAFALAVPVAWNREKQARSAGLRTFPLVALASCGFIQSTESLLAQSPDATARIVAGVITGIGFIGGGVILKQGNSVHGTATAASLWATAAIGTSVGLGTYDVAIIITVLTFIALKFLQFLKESNEAVDLDES